MRHLAAIALWLIALCSVAGVVGGSWWLHEKHDEAGGTDPEEAGTQAAAAGKDAAGKEEEETEAEPLSAGEKELAGLRTEPLNAARWYPEIQALGRVLDPGPLVSLWTEYAMSTASLTASQAEVERDRQLFAKGGSVSRGLLDQAEAVVATDRLKREAVLHRLRFEWGPAWVEAQPDFQAALLAGTTVMLRAEIGSSVPLKAPPVEARIFISGQETAPIAASRILPVASVDSKLQGSAWLLLIPGNTGTPAPGSALGVSLRTSGEEKTGVLIPASAVLQFEGKTWAFLEDKEHPGQYTRRPVKTDRPLAGGYFADEGFAVGDQVVTTAAATLLARQTLNQTPEEE